MQNTMDHSSTLIYNVLFMFFTHSVYKSWQKLITGHVYVRYLSLVGVFATLPLLHTWYIELLMSCLFFCE